MNKTTSLSFFNYLKKDNINRFISLGIIVMISVSPLFCDESINYNMYSQQILLLRVFCSLSCLYLILNPSLYWNKISWQPLDIIFLIFFFYYSTNTIVLHKITPNDCYFQYYLGLTITYFVIRIVISKFYTNSNEGLKYIIYVIIGVGIVNCVIGIRDISRASSSLINFSKILPFKGNSVNSARFAAYLLTVLPLIISIILFNLFAKSKKHLIIIAIILCFILLLTYSRAAFVGLLGGLIYLFLARIKKRITAKTIISLITIGLVSITLLYFLKSESADGRVLIWKICAQNSGIQSIFGIGLGQFQKYYNLWQAEFFGSGLGSKYEEYIAGCMTFPLNSYLQLFLELGIFGILIVTIFFIYFFKIRQKDTTLPKSVYYGIKSAIISILIFSFFSYTQVINAAMLNLTILTALFASRIKMPQSYKVKSAIIILLCWTIFFTGLWGMPRRYLEYKKIQIINKASILYQNKKYEDAIEKFKEAYVYHEYNGHFLLKYGCCLYDSGDIKNAKIVLQKSSKLITDPHVLEKLGDCHFQLNEFKLAEKSYKIAQKIIPHRITPGYKLFKLYCSQDKNLLAENEAKKISQKEIKILSTEAYEMKKEIVNYLDSINESQ